MRLRDYFPKAVAAIAIIAICGCQTGRCKYCGGYHDMAPDYSLMSPDAGPIVYGEPEPMPMESPTLAPGAQEYEVPAAPPAAFPPAPPEAPAVKPVPSQEPASVPAKATAFLKRIGWRVRNVF